MATSRPTRTRRSPMSGPNGWPRSVMTRGSGRVRRHEHRAEQLASRPLPRRHGMNAGYQVPLAVLAGLGVAAGALLFVAGLRGPDPDAEPARSLRLTGPMAARLAGGLAAGLVILVLTRWVAVGIGERKDERLTHR